MQSVLRVTPASSQKHYGTYICKAENPYGEAFQEILLFEAALPRQVTGVHVRQITATTIEFGIVGPWIGDSGRLPIETYAVEYKETRTEWNDAKKR